MAQVIRSAQVEHEPVLIRCRREEPSPLEIPAPAPVPPAAASFIERAAPVEDPREALDELRRQAAAEGYREGLERGEREGKALLAEETEQLRRLAASLGEALEGAIGGAEDAMVEIASSLDGVIGARMTGGGFGGCTVNLVRRDRVEDFQVVLNRRYEQATGLRPEVYVCAAGSGVEEVS